MNRKCKGFEQESFSPIGVGGSIVEADTAFSWGYVDVIDAEGNGVVIIWGFANPFVPGTLSRFRKDSRPAAADEPSLCVSVYERGRSVFYLVRKLPAVTEASPFAAGGVDLCGVSVRFEEGLTVTLDVPVPGGDPVVGELRLKGVRPRLVPDAPSSEHRWGPRLLGDAQVRLRSGAWSFAMQGRGYHDGNASTAGLHALGIEGWVWGRVSFEDGDWIHYLVQGEGRDLRVDHSLFVHPDGQVERLEGRVTMDERVRSFWGTRYARRFQVDGFTVEVGDLVDDGPFYLRMNTRVRRDDGRVGFGVGEVVHVPSMDTGWTAPLTKMAVVAPRGSWFSPLFSGPRRGRWTRLLRYWMGR